MGGPRSRAGGRRARILRCTGRKSRASLLTLHDWVERALCQELTGSYVYCTYSEEIN